MGVPIPKRSLFPLSLMLLLCSAGFANLRAELESGLDSSGQEGFAPKPWHEGSSGAGGHSWLAEKANDEGAQAAGQSKRRSLLPPVPPTKVVYETVAEASTGESNRSGASVTTVGLDSTLQVTTEMQFRSGAKRTELQRSVAIPADSRAWQNLVQPKNGILLLGRLLETDGKSATLEYLVLDTSREDFLLSTPTMKLTFGEKSTMTLDNGHDRIDITVLVKAPAASAKTKKR